MRITRIVAVGIGTAALMIGSAGTAMAGEVTGNGESTGAPTHANSFCSFSGLNDEPDDPFPEGGKAQSYGQLVSKGLKEFIPSPGTACNPTSGFGE